MTGFHQFGGGAGSKAQSATVLTGSATRRAAADFPG